MNILFYSRQCKTSLVVLKLLKATGLLNNFKLICVDDNLSNIPQQITRVPTMIMSNMKYPLVANDIIKWIEGIRFMRSQKQTVEAPLPPTPEKTDTEYTDNRPILGYIESEMSGMSDNFAFKDIDVALPHAFVEYGKDDKNPIFTAPESLKKLTSSDQNKIIRDTNETRRKQDEEYEQIMKERQMYALLNEQRGKNI